MKTGQTYHEQGCSCGWCLTGETRHPITEVIAEIGEDRQWIRQNPTYIDGVLERERKIKENIIKLGYDPIQSDFHVTNPAHGGKVTCHKCNGFILKKDDVPYLDHQHPCEFAAVHFHKKCYNGNEHYYGLDKPID